MSYLPSTPEPSYLVSRFSQQGSWTNLFAVEVWVKREKFKMGFNPLGVNTTQEMSLLTSHHLLKTNVKEHMGIETFWVNLGGLLLPPRPWDECLGKGQACIILTNDESDLVKLVAVSPCPAPGVHLLALSSPSLFPSQWTW